MPATTSFASTPDPRADPGQGETRSAPGALDRILGPRNGIAYQRFLDWSVGDGFLLAVVELRVPWRRDALVKRTVDAVPNARLVRLDRVGDRPLRVYLEEACPSPAETSMLVLTHLEEARDRHRLCAELNVHRDELARRYALPWVLVVHPAAALDLQRIAPDFCDFAGLWLPEDQEEAAESVALEQVIRAPGGRGAPSSHLSQGTATSKLLERAFEAIERSHLDEATDLLARYDLDHLDARRNDAQRIRLEGNLLWARGLPVEALARFEEALRLCEAMGNQRSKAVLLGDIIQVRMLEGNMTAARRLEQETLEIHEQMGDLKGWARSLHQLAVIEESQGNYTEARVLLQETLRTQEELGDQQGRAASLHELAVIEESQGNDTEARALLRESLRTQEELGDQQGRAASLHELAILECNQGNYLEARELLRVSLRIQEDLGNRYGRSASLHQLANLEYNQGNYLEARELLSESLRITEELGDKQGWAASLYQLARVKDRQGNHTEARKMLRKSLQTLEEVGDRHGRAVSLITLGQLEAAQGQLEDGMALVREGIGILEAIGARDLALAQEILRDLDG